MKTGPSKRHPTGIFRLDSRWLLFMAWRHVSLFSLSLCVLFRHCSGTAPRCPRKMPFLRNNWALSLQERSIGVICIRIVISISRYLYIPREHPSYCIRSGNMVYRQQDISLLIGRDNSETEQASYVAIYTRRMKDEGWSFYGGICSPLWNLIFGHQAVLRLSSC